MTIEIDREFIKSLKGLNNNEVETLLGTLAKNLLNEREIKPRQILSHAISVVKTIRPEIGLVLEASGTVAGKVIKSTPVLREIEKEDVDNLFEGFLTFPGLFMPIRMARGGWGLGRDLAERHKQKRDTR